jgi:hypothetical protein
MNRPRIARFMLFIIKAELPKRYYSGNQLPAKPIRTITYYED